MPEGFTIPFIDHLGIEFVDYGHGRSHLRFDPRPEHRNAYGMAHGGVTMTLLDVTMAFAALDPEVPEMGAITVEMKTSFLRPATGVLTARGRLVHRTNTFVFLEATVYNDADQACAQASGTFVLKQRPPQRTAATPAQVEMTQPEALQPPSTVQAVQTLPSSAPWLNAPTLQNPIAPPPPASNHWDAVDEDAFDADLDLEMADTVLTDSEIGELEALAQVTASSPEPATFVATDLAETTDSADDAIEPADEAAAQNLPWHELSKRAQPEPLPSHASRPALPSAATASWGKPPQAPTTAAPPLAPVVAAPAESEPEPVDESPSPPSISSALSFPRRRPTHEGDAQ